MIDHHTPLMLITIHGGFTQILNMLVYVKSFKVFTTIGKKNNRLKLCYLVVVTPEIISAQHSRNNGKK